MGTGSSVPRWAMEVQLMERFGWTERELFEDVSLETIVNVGKLNKIRAEADAYKGRRAKVSSSPGEEVIRWDTHM